MTVRANTNRRANANAKTNSGGSTGTYIFIGILVLALLGAGVYFFFWKKGLPTNIDVSTFSGSLLGMRVSGKLSDITTYLQSQPSPPGVSGSSPLTSIVIDCSNK